MKKSEFREAFDALTTKMQDLNDKVSAEKREMTAEETAQFNAWAREAETLKTKAQMAAAESNTKAVRENKSLVAQLREAIKENKRSITVDGYTSGSSTVAGVHDDVVETEIQGILDPLYTNSVLSELGVRFYSGLPQGDIQVPVMGKGTVGWADEIGAAGAADQTFTHVTLQPKRLTAYVDISKKLIMQDTIGAEAAIRRDLVNAIKDKLEGTIFGYAKSSTTQPGGLFNGKTLSDANTFAKICEIEAGLEDACVSGNMKYLLSPKAKATLRAMAKSTKNTQLVMEGGAVDGVPAIVSANVIDSASTTKGAYIYGNFDNLAVGSWGNIEITIDEYTQAVNGCVRLVVNAYFDAKVLREAAFAYGDVRHA